MPTYDHGVAGLTGTIGVTVLNADGTSHDARTTTGITEPVAGSGVYHVAHPHPGTLLLFIFDGGVGTVGASVWDDGLTTMPARAGDAMTLTTAERTAVKDAVEAGASMTDLVARNEALDAAGTRGALGMAAADLDAQLDAIGASATSAANAAKAAQAAAEAISDKPPAGYTRYTIAPGTLLPGTVIDAYLPDDTTYSTPQVDNAVIASNGGGYIDLPEGGTYTLVGRLVGKSNTVLTGVTT